MIGASFHSVQNLFVFIVLALCGCSRVWATIGVDVSTLVSVPQAHCFRTNGVEFLVARVYMEVGQCDMNGLQTAKNARAAGIQYVDGYIYPDQAQDAAGQVDAMLGCISQSGAELGMIWIDIEGNWGPNKAGNANFILAMSQRLVARGIDHGVYTNANGWNTITGGSTALANRALWWPFWDGQPSWAGWSGFGGWAKPNIKQYVGDTTLCGVGVDKNFY